ncbi:tyrosine-type recombinase/integrase [Pseudoalteromonas sp. SCSIO 43101]|uniref:tyrosine-type recombinase/integrase n=1 Tax=Pseudoalteromonas sp. SCSIO 43101 TaxID=2822847 RepID=UPI00202AD870|nr:tyrosine-type recombinase/integrase [Pseudoalteromonas sp. SCSIO 43101]URQ90000.1 site-specific integrase [Pseudoalteromonas sp. SCSIO 43101]
MRFQTSAIERNYLNGGSYNGLCNPLLESNDITVGDLLSHAIGYSLQNHRDFKGYIAKAHYWDKHIGTYSVNDTSLLRAIRAQLLELSQSVKPPTVARYIAALSTAFTVGVNNGLITFNPCKLIAKPKESRPRERLLSQSEVSSFIKACRADSNQSHALALELCLYTGLRFGNIRSIKVDWLSDSDKCLEIPLTKSGKPYTAFLSFEAQKVVKEAKEYVRNGYLFPATRGSGYMSKPTKLFARVVNRMKQDGCLSAPFVIHDLRRSFASHLLKATGDIRLVQQMLGHANVSTTERYAYHVPDTLKHASQLAANTMLAKSESEKLN